MKDGGPAFPSANEIKFGDYATSGHSGMTLRQWYKGAALMGVVQAGIVQANLESRDTTRDIAKWCAVIADALLREDEEASK